jgi:hypothetical protein
MKQRLLTIFLLLPSLLTVPRLLAQDDAVMADIHKRLSTPGYEATHDHDRILFVGEITALGPVFQGVCKGAVNQSVDYRVNDVLLGDPPDPIIHTGYINCTHVTLPSPPFTLHAKVIVYCFHNMSGKFFKCLSPLAFTEARLKQLKSWAAALPVPASASAHRSNAVPTSILLTK